MEAQHVTAFLITDRAALSVIAIAFSTVLLSELGADKMLYTAAALALRLKIQNLLLGVSAAVAGKMLIAVLFGQALGSLDPRRTALLSALTFFLSAIMIASDSLKDQRILKQADGRRSTVVLSFTAVFLSDWGDPGQIAAAALAMSTHSPFAVWCGSTLACILKSSAGILVGAALQDRLPIRKLRLASVLGCTVLGILALTGWK